MISTQDALKLARKLGIEKLINTGTKTAFGYGGARNAIYFLAPILKECYHKGKRTIQQVLKSPKIELQDLLHTSVLGIRGQDALIVMGDDDLVVPPSSLFSDALFAFRNRDKYFTLRFYSYGRSTDTYDPNIDLPTLLKFPSLAYRSTVWLPFAKESVLNGCLTKPKVCLPLPYACEEQHFRALHFYAELFRQPWKHLAGTRFPLEIIPTRSFMGLSAQMKRIVPYSFHVILVQWLIYSEQEESPILPWDRHELFSSLGEVLKLAKEQKKWMHINLWLKLSRLFSSPVPSLLAKTVNKLIEFPDDLIARELKIHPFTSKEKKELIALEKLYKSFQQDAIIFKACCQRLLEIGNINKMTDLPNWIRDLQKAYKKQGIDIQKLPLTSSLFTILQTEIPEIKG